MANRKDFVVRKGAQVASNVVIGTYTNANAAPAGGMIVSGNVGIGTATVDSNVALHVSGSLGVTRYYMDDASNYPGYAPSLNLNFVGSSTLDSRISFTRASTATYVGADGYIKTAQLNVPRFDYNPAYSPARPTGLLIEDTRTNQIQYSQDLDNAYYTGTTGATATPTSATLSPDNNGTTSYTLIEDTTLGPHTLGRSGAYTAPSVGTSMSTSIFAKALPSGSMRYLALYITGAAYTVVGPYIAVFDITTAGATAGTCVYQNDPSVVPSISYYGNGWYRCGTSTVTTASGGITVDYRMSTGTTGANYTGDGASGLYMWGPQLEAASIVSSYIPTNGAAATRSAENANLAMGAWYNPLSSSLLVEASKNSSNDTGYGGIVEINDGSVNNRFEFYVGLSTATVRFADAYTSNTGDAGISIGNFTPGSPYKVAGSISQGSIAASINGNLAVTGTTANFPGSSLNNMAIGHLGANTDYHNGWIRTISYWPRSLTSAQLASMTKV